MAVLLETGIVGYETYRCLLADEGVQGCSKAGETSGERSDRGGCRIRDGIRGWAPFCLLSWEEGLPQPRLKSGCECVYIIKHLLPTADPGWGCDRADSVHLGRSQ